MVNRSIIALAGLALLFPTISFALAVAASVPSCPTTVSSSVPAPSAAKGYAVNLIANGLTKPRGIIVDSAGHLLVVQSGVGIQALTFSDAGGVCLSVSNSKAVVSVPTLNHGIALSVDGKTLYASDSNSVYMWGYNPFTASTTTSATTIITNMTNPDHVSRTLHMSKFAADTLIVSRGSGANLDPVSSDVTSGRAQIRAFDLAARTGVYNYATDGKMLGWGLRNDVGVDENPVTGGIFSVENSADELTRQGVDIHQDNPGEELNYLGMLVDNKSKNQGGNFGYPECFGLWNRSLLPDNENVRVGQQFVIGDITATNNDLMCRSSRVAPRLVFQPHNAPLDISFNPSGSEAWITFHGSWNSAIPVGYKVSVVKFKNGQPVASSRSHGAAKDIIINKDTSACPGSCFRPVGLAWDTNGRLYFSSDATGEVYVVTGAAN